MISAISDDKVETMVDIKKQTDEAYNPTQRHYKFPILYHMGLEEILHEADCFDFYGEYEHAFGTYRNLHAFPACSAITYENKQAEEEMNIYMVFSRWDSAVVVQKDFPPWIYPIQAGSVLGEKKIGPFLDETGISISEKNGTFAEMTAAYWIWKNAKPVKYKGLCHYRRHFVLSESEVKALDVNHVDVILTTPRYAPGGVGRMFLAETPVKEPVYRNMLEAVAYCHPNDEDTFRHYMESCLYCPNNMVIARSEIYDMYCEWIFPVLFTMLETDVKSSYGHTGDRHIAYAAELLTSYFFAKHKDDYHIAMTDYKFYV